MELGRPGCVLVVANRTAATPWLLQEIERRADVPELLLLVPPLAGRRRGRDWSPAAAHRLVARAARKPVRVLTPEPDAFAAVRRALRDEQVDEVIVSIPRRRWPRRDLLRRIENLGVAVTAVIPGARPGPDERVLTARWDC